MVVSKGNSRLTLPPATICTQATTVSLSNIEADNTLMHHFHLGFSLRCRRRGSLIEKELPPLRNVLQEHCCPLAPLGVIEADRTQHFRKSGTLTGGYTKSRTEGPVSEAAAGRPHEATGRPVLTAASPGKSAYENYKGHSVLTYALMEALHLGDTNNNGKIEVTELAEYVERRVPALFVELKQSGWVGAGRGSPVRRGEGGEEDKTQTAHSARRTRIFPS